MYSVLEVLALGFTIGLTGAMAPGPTLLATVNSSLKFGWTSGPKMAAGHALVELVIFILIVQGIAMAPQRYSSYISVIGGVALILFGALTLKGSKNASMVRPDGGKAENPYIAGVLTSAANPYFWIWWLSIGSAMILDGLRTSLFLAALFLIGHWGADFAWYGLVSTSIDRGRAVLSERSYRIILAFCGLMLMVFGAYYLTRA
jgi:threonine/homoserine/homoserine lactone efflux protein